MTKKTLTLFSTGSVLVLGLSMSGLPSITHADDAFNDKSLDKKAEKKPTEGMCGGNMRMDMKGMVMNENKDRLPKDCEEISEDITFNITAGIAFAKPFPGTVFGFDQHQWQAKPCARITIEFTNNDDIRHQWMIHGLPKYLYPQGMFHIEVNGQGKKIGTFIVPSSHFTYLVHCDIAQHMEKGMKAQLKVGKGRGDLPSIPGISDPTFFGQFALPNQ
jgi:hypothetical protein